MKVGVIPVALGNPGREVWIARHQSHISALLLMGVWAMFDFVTGTVPRAAHWVCRLRFEWLFCLRKEPRRLGHRYTPDIVHFLVGVLAQRLGRRSVS